jgi:hypothetical protein
MPTGSSFCHNAAATVRRRKALRDRGWREATTLATTTIEARSHRAP